MDHYYETYVGDEKQITFYYLSNKVDRSEVIYASIDGIEVYPISYGETSYRQEFNHQYLKFFSFALPMEQIPINNGIEESWSFKTIDVAFSNGERILADIGEVVVHPDVPVYNGLEWRASSTNNHYLSQTFMIATTPNTIEAITVPESVGSEVDVKVNINQETVKTNNFNSSWIGKNLDAEWDEVDGLPINEMKFPFTLNADDWLQISVKLNPDLKKFFEFDVLIQGTTDQGKPLEHITRVIEYPYLSQKDINAIISEKQGGSIN